jgi:hypothetical protein
LLSLLGLSSLLFPVIVLAGCVLVEVLDGVRLDTVPDFSAGKPGTSRSLQGSSTVVFRATSLCAATPEGASWSFEILDAEWMVASGAYGAAKGSDSDTAPCVDGDPVALTLFCESEIAPLEKSAPLLATACGGGSLGEDVFVD